MNIVTMLLLTLLQSASFTLVSRARNSASVGFHAMAAVLSNGIYLLVLRKVVMNLNTPAIMVTYLIGSVMGAVSMHVVSMRFLEKGKRKVSP